jgi:hypothetical protein
MPWELTIVGSPTDEKIPLGPRQLIIDAVAKILPGTVLQRPPLPPQDFLDSLSPTVRDAFTRPQLEAAYEVDKLSFEFHTWDFPNIPFLCVNVRGEGNPLPVLRKLCVPNGWTVVSGSDKSAVDLEADTAIQWDAFREFRDDAFNDEI